MTQTARKKRDSTTVPRVSLTREDWIDAATAVLVEEGIGHVRVDVLANQMEVSRGSFYWHFKDREELLRSVLDAWRMRATENLTARLEVAHQDPREQIHDVIGLPFRGRAASRAANIELAIRAWARRDKMARKAVDKADASRLAYISQVFCSLGFPIAEARHRAALLYSLVVGQSFMPALEGISPHAARNEYVEALLMRPPLMGGDEQSVPSTSPPF